MPVAEDLLTVWRKDSMAFLDKGCARRTGVVDVRACPEKQHTVVNE